MNDALPRQIFPAGAQIYTEGDNAQFAYMIEAGNVELLASRNGLLNSWAQGSPVTGVAYLYHAAR